MTKPLDQLQALWSSLPSQRRLAMAVVLAAVMGGLLWVATSAATGDYQALYTNMEESDAARVADKLKTMEVPYRARPGSEGVTVLIPASKVTETRLAMAASGLPSSGRMGFELFDQSDFAATEFSEKIKFARALEGELERSVQLIDAVAKARVHVTFAKDSVFLESRRPAKASVMVRLRPGAYLNPQNVRAITMLVSRAVEGLEPDAVSILDMDGNLLSQPDYANDQQMRAGEASLDYRKRLEQGLLAKIRGTLDPLLGPDHYTAGVSMEIDISESEQSEELFNPEQSVIASSEKTEEAGGRRLSAGVPGTASNLPRPTPQAAPGVAEVTRRSENVRYQSSRTVRKVRTPQGRLERISVGVVFDHRVKFATAGDPGSVTLEPAAPEKIEAIEKIVAAVAGLKPERGDQIMVQTLAFDETLNRVPAPAAPPAAPAPAPGGNADLPEWLAPWVERLRNDPVFLAIAAGSALGLLGLFAFLFWRKRSPKKVTASVKQALPGHSAKALEGIPNEALSPEQARLKLEEQMLRRLEEHQAKQDELTAEELLKLKLTPVTTKQSEVLNKHLRETVKKDPEFAAQVLMTWISEDR